TEAIAPAAATVRKRPRIDLGGLGERKRGKSMFGIVLGTLNKAKIEDKERNASDAAKKRHLIEQRLQTKLKRETDSVRRAEEAKKDKTSATRKEEELQFKDSIQKLRRTRYPILANFLLTSDIIPSTDSEAAMKTEDSQAEGRPPVKLTSPSRSHPPPLYYLPAVLLPSQEAFLTRRKAEVSKAAEAEWTAFREERSAGIEEIHTLRERVAEEDARRRKEQEEKKLAAGEGLDKELDEAKAKDEDMKDDSPKAETAEKAAEAPSAPAPAAAKEDVEMEVDDGAPAAKNTGAPEPVKEKEGQERADEEDAVEY
ncbi:hypothetical protein CONPUDRAFT_36976, partial [Coniophora puteana RWD-64-598 SS2]